MKKSRRLIRNTILALNGLMVLYVGINRLYAVDETTQAPPLTEAAELAKLRDFNAIEVSGNFSVDVVQDADYSIGLLPPGASKGRFDASVRGNTLVLHGYRHTPGTRVRVAMPALTQLVVGEEVPALTVSGFNGASLSLLLNGKSQVELRNNAVRQWHVFASGSSELQVDRASFGAGKVALAGRVTLSLID